MHSVREARRNAIGCRAVALLRCAIPFADLRGAEVSRRRRPDAWAGVALTVAVTLLLSSVYGLGGASTASASTSSDAAFVTAAYHDFLDRAPSPAESAAGVAAVSGGQRAGFLTVLANSNEWVAHIVTGFYQDTLGRNPDSTGLAYWEQQVESGGLTVAQVAADFYASPEYFAGFGHSDLSTWVGDLYMKLLHRSPDPTGQNYWAVVAQVDGRPAVTYPFYQSPESLGVRVNTLYRVLLRRAGDPAGVTYWSGQILNRGDIFLAIALASSDEYYAGAQTRAYPTTPPYPAVQVSTGGGYTCALLLSAAVECWGQNEAGVLGNGTVDTGLSPHPAPGLVAGITNALGVSAGHSHACALLVTGNVVCWGATALAPHPTTTPAGDDPTPVEVPGITTATQVSAGGAHTCVRLSSGHVTCWGNNKFGQLGTTTNNGMTTPVQTPVEVPGITNATQVSTGDADTCAVLATGHISCWGLNENGQLGTTTNDNSTAPNPTPTEVPTIANATQVAAGIVHTCAVLADATVDCWGLNISGQLGTFTNVGTLHPNPTPTAVPGVTDAAEVAVADNNTCAVSKAGQAMCWGANVDGLLGPIDPNLNPVPATAVPGITNAAQIAASYFATCAVVTNLRVECWGTNSYGQLGTTTNNRTQTPNPWPTEAGSG